MNRRQKRERKARRRETKRILRYMRKVEKIRRLWQRGIEVFSSSEDFFSEFEKAIKLEALK